MPEITLRNPILVDGKEVKTFKYDYDEITSALYDKAHALSTKAQQAQGTMSFLDEIDSVTQRYLGMAAIIAVNPQLDFMDLDRIKGRDIIAIARLGRDFLTESDESPQESSDEQPEATRKNTQPQTSNS